MGVTWSMEVLSWAVNNVAWVFYISDVCNCIQGFLIFMLFVWKQKVKRLIYKKYVCGANLSVCTLSRNALEQNKKKVHCGLQLFSARSFLIYRYCNTLDFRRIFLCFFGDWSFSFLTFYSCYPRLIHCPFVKRLNFHCHIHQLIIFINCVFISSPNRQ